MGDRAKVNLNEFWALELLKKDELNLNHFYNSDLKVLLTVAIGYIKSLENTINEVKKRVLDENKPVPSALEIIDIIDKH